MEGFPSGCGFARAIIPIAVPSRTQVLPGGPQTAQILFAFYQYTYGSSAVAGSENLENDGMVFTWHGRARGRGWQRVRGTATVLSAPKQHLLDWSFDYFAMSALSAFLQTGRRSLLYRCQPNEVQLQAAAGYYPDALELRVPGAVVEKLGGGKYSVTVSDERLRQCRGLVLDGKDTIGALLMDVVDAPLPLPDFGGGLPLSALTAMAELPLQKEEGAEAQIVSYRLLLLPGDDREEQTIEVPSGRFAGEASVDALLQTAGPGDRLLFSSILIRQGCGLKSLPGTVSLRIIR